MQFYWLRDERRNPVALIASEAKNGQVGASLAIPNPRDRFDKARGRLIATGRLAKGPLYVVPQEGDVKARLLTHIAHDQDLPMRVRDAAHFWLNKPRGDEHERPKSAAGDCGRP